MRDFSLVDPQLVALLEQFPGTDLNDGTLPAARALAHSMAMQSSALSTSEAVRSEVWIPGPNGAPDVRLVIHLPPRVGVFPVILHIHGGGMVLGSADMSNSQNAELAVRHDCAVISVDYRLAPETTAPGNVEDCYAALEWINASPQNDQFDAGNTIVMGESAGGGLAAALVLLARDRGQFWIAAQFLKSPMLDDRTGSTTRNKEPYGQHVWTAAKNRFGWTALLGTLPGGDSVSPYASPARATELTGVPPTYISIGALDLFFHESLEFARRLADASVPVELHVYPGAFHGFEMATNSDLAKHAALDLQLALTRRLRAQV